MKKTGKKLLAIATAVSLAALALSGCGEAALPLRQLPSLQKQKKKRHRNRQRRQELSHLPGMRITPREILS